MNKHTPWGGIRVEDIPRLIDALCEMYDELVANLRTALARYLKNGERPDPEARAEGLFAYPELRIDYRYGAPRPSRARVRPAEPPRAATRPASPPHLFRKYLTEQLTYLIDDYEVEVSVGRSTSEIPYPYVLDGTDDLRLDGAQAADLALWFPTTELAHIGDEIADGEWLQPPARRGRCRCSTGRGSISAWRALDIIPARPSEHTQRYLLFTNYVRYVDEFVRWAVDELKRPDSPYEASPPPAASMSPRIRRMPSRRSPRAAGAGTRCRPII